ncbi:type III polyketide synthase [Planctomycetes bacterium Pan216]
MGVSLEGLATSLPRHGIEQSDAVEFANALCCENEEQTRLLAALYRRSGVGHRHSVLLEASEGERRQQFFEPAQSPGDRGPSTAERMARYEEEAPRLALDAARKTLAESGTLPEEITHLVTVSCSGFSAPGVDIQLIKELELRRDVGRVHVGFMGCHGVINGLRVAESLVRGGGARVLGCAVELCSLHFRYGWEPDMAVANALFADGAGTFLARPRPQRRERGFMIRGTGSCLIPGSEDCMSWRIGDHGFEMTLSARVPELIETHLEPWLTTWLEGYGMGLDDIRAWAVHPGGPRVLRSVTRALRLEDQALEASRGVLAELGNMSSPTILFILDRLRQTEVPRPCIAMAFGPGLVVETALLV